MIQAWKDKTCRALYIMLFGVSLEGRDEGGKSGKQKQSFQVFVRYFLSSFFFFLKGFLIIIKNGMMGSEKVFSHRYARRMAYREEGISTNPLMIVPSMKRENSIFFFPQEQIIRTRHVSARKCFVRLRLKLTDQVQGFSCVCRSRARCINSSTMLNLSS